VAIRGDDEVAELGRSFNLMAADIARVRRRERDFLANISHDLKTPLTSIQGFAGALIDGTCPPDAYPDAARIIYSESQRMVHLVGDILQLSRLEAGELTLTVAPVDLAALLRATAQRFADTASKAGVTIRLEGATDHPVFALADHGRIEQVLGNVVENALRFTAPGGRIDLISGRQDGAGPPLACLAVRDTGAGIAASDLSRIFERFYQADKSRVAGRAGSGLGLAIVRELVERHGGTVHAESIVGAGTTITMTLPLAPEARREGDTADTASNSPITTGPATAQVGGQRKR